ncbi:methylated-DNA--protein-cysteine methyltransferase [Acrocarpospora phusangensis]|uniref:methylated-DNA--[protein]-cysteine S-methyltransferase n=2 Tax=Acrocarpospora phusangensis TaxID=1070424 RepID=A0A919QD32_9ACTN|nr:methylated-DNA--protein-cysteine methyltransferase [Acrocarpospora phusangensis]
MGEALGKPTLQMGPCGAVFRTGLSLCPYGRRVPGSRETVGGAADNGGMAETVAFGSVPTEVGEVLAAVTPVGVVAVHFRDSERNRERIAARVGMPVVEDERRVSEVRAELAAYFAGDLREFGVEVDWRLMSGSRRRVLGLLYESVPFGKVVTYGDLAAETGVPARAIGSIMGSNPIPVIVPCHRVVAGDGLGGFSGGDGVESKRWLLTHEGHLPLALF